MVDLIDFLDSIEKLAYKILLWIILIPKTLWRIITDPAWVPAYIKGQLADEESPFDEHISPVFLLLIVGVVPALLTAVLPNYGVVISSPAEAEPTTDRTLEFDANSMFISAALGVADEYRWYVERILTDDNGEFIADENGNFKALEIYREVYNQDTDKTTITNTQVNITETRDGEAQTVLSSTPGEGVSQDMFFYSFEEPGYFYVNVEAVRFRPGKNASLEKYYAYLAVYVPDATEEPIEIINVAPPQNAQSDKNQVQDIRELFTSEAAILLALVFLTPPLFFAFVTKLLVSEKVSEDSLKENFYAQCYYFSPLSLTFWATVYAIFFYTIDIFFYNNLYILTMLLPLMLAILWFIFTEIYAIALAGRTNVWTSLVVVLTCIFIIGAIVVLILLCFGLKDELRKGAIWAYPLIFYMVLTGLILIRFFGWVSGTKKVSAGDMILLLSFLPATFIFVGGNLLGRIAVPAAPTPTPIYISPLPTPGNVLLVAPLPTAIPLIPVTANTFVASPTAPGNPTTYVIHAGEFPYCIARRFNVHPAELLASNGLIDGQGLSQGTTLSIPQNGSQFPGNRALRSHPTIYIVVSSNETLYSVACQFGDVDPGAIGYANGISIDTALSIGQQLQIP